MKHMTTEELEADTARMQEKLAKIRRRKNAVLARKQAKAELRNQKLSWRILKGLGSLGLKLAMGIGNWLVGTKKKK